jgi:hypothetical protein
MFVLPRRTSRFQQLCLALLSTLWLAPAPHARADGQRVIVISSADVPEELEKGVKQALEPVCYISDASQYLAAARGQKLAPTADAALTRLGPKAHARMLVVLDFESRKLHVTYRDGKNAAVLDEQSVPARGRRPKLAGRASKAVRAKAQAVLAKLSGQSAPAVVDDGSDTGDDDDEEDEPAKPAKRAAPARQPTPQPKAAAAPSEPEPSESEEAEAEEQAAPESAAAGSDGGGSEPISVRIRAGGGAGARMLTVPTRTGGSQIDTGFAFPAIAIGIEGQVVLGGHVILGASADYRTLLGGRAVQQIGADTHDSSVSSHSFGVGVMPGYRFGARGSTELRLFLGYGFRTLSPVDTALPGATSAGVVLRPELRIPLAGEVLTLRLAPEVMVVLTHDTTLPGNVAGLDPVGVGFGGEVSLDVRLASMLLLGVEYRESHVSVASGWNTSFSDVERFAVGRLTLQL